MGRPLCCDEALTHHSVTPLPAQLCCVSALAVVPLVQPHCRHPSWQPPALPVTCTALLCSLLLHHGPPLPVIQPGWLLVVPESFCTACMHMCQLHGCVPCGKTGFFCVESGASCVMIPPAGASSLGGSVVELKPQGLWGPDMGHVSLAE